jgi:Flp pilus assembly protein TadG
MLKDQKSKGSVFIEAAIGLPILLFILLVGLDFVLMFYKYSTLQHVLQEVQRWYVVGNKVTDDDGSVLSSNDGIKHLIITKAHRMGVKLNAGDIEIATIENATADVGTLVEISLVSEHKMMVYPTRIRLEARGRARNETGVS